MSVKYLDWIKREDLRAAPKARFVFGDNRQRIGMGGQAGAMRGEPNAIGVATLHAPGVFYGPNDADALAAVTVDLAKVAAAIAEGREVYVPRDGLGTGIARLTEHAPAIHHLITAFFRAAPGEPCPWKE